MLHNVANYLGMPDNSILNVECATEYIHMSETSKNEGRCPYDATRFAIENLGYLYEDEEFGCIEVILKKLFY